ncbi:hypothetical protein QSV83_25040 [Escherichia coli]|nr:hypothetical protein [Escherichia coli]
MRLGASESVLGLSGDSSPKEQQRDHRQHARGDTARRKSMTERSERIDEEAEENRKPH